MNEKRHVKGRPLTKEQNAIVDGSLRGRDMRIGAGAGTGKTSTLLAISEYIQTHKKGLYISFSRDSVKDALDVFPYKVKCKTGHGLAFPFMAKNPDLKAKFEKANNGTRLSFPDIEEAINKRSTNNIKLFTAIQKTLNNFLQSADAIVNKKHLSPAVLAWQETEEMSCEEQQKNVIYLTDKLWHAMSSPNSPCGLTHDGYLKLFQLSKPRLHYDYIMVDEAQDTNPVLFDIINNQDCQTIWVGDTHQSIYGWRNAVNAMEKINADQLHLTNSFRFGKDIAAAANRCLLWKKEPIFLKGRGHDFIPFREDKKKTILCRGNMGVLNKVLEHFDEGKKVFVIGGVTNIARLLESAYALSVGDTHNNKSIELMDFATWKEYKEYAGSSQEPEAIRLISIVEKEKRNTLNIAKKLRDSESGDINLKNAEIVISTVHKTKGMEFSQVEIHNDFNFPVMKNGTQRNLTKDEILKMEKMSLEEMNVIYVAMTRAKVSIKIPPEYRGFFCSKKEGIINSRKTFDEFVSQKRSNIIDDEIKTSNQGSECQSSQRMM